MFAWFSSIASHLFVAVLCLLIGCGISASFLIQNAKTLSADGNWFETPNGIDESLQLEIGGVDHFVRIRGRDLGNPVIVDLHGGPGAAQSAYTYRTFRPLTEFFTLVEWDQRGAGRSGQGEPSEATYPRMVADTVELIEHIRLRLGVEKVILVGHSWGTMLGLGVAQSRPDLLHAYVGVGQGLAWQATFDETQRLLVEKARKAGDDAILSSLQNLPDEWPDASDANAVLERIAVIHKPLGAMGQGMHASHSGEYMRSTLFLDTITSPEITLWQAWQMLSPSKTILALVSDLSRHDFREGFDENYQVPMIVFQGEHDWQTPTTLVKPWFAALKAPEKHYVAFEDSGHFISQEEPGRYLFEMVNRVRPYALSSEP